MRRVMCDCGTRAIEDNRAHARPSGEWLGGVATTRPAATVPKLASNSNGVCPTLYLHEATGCVLDVDRKVDGDASPQSAEVTLHLDTVEALLFAEPGDAEVLRTEPRGKVPRAVGDVRFLLRCHAGILYAGTRPCQVDRYTSQQRVLFTPWKARLIVWS